MNGYDRELKDIIENSPDFYKSTILRQVYSCIGTSEVQNSRLLLDTLLRVESNRLALLNDYVKVASTGKHPKTVIVDSMMRLGDSKNHKPIEQENKKFEHALDTMDRLAEFYANADLAKCCFPFGYDEDNNKRKGVVEMTREETIERISKISEEMSRDLTIQEREQYCKDNEIKYEDFYPYRYGVFQTQLEFLTMELKHNKEKENELYKKAVLEALDNQSIPKDSEEYLFYESLFENKGMLKSVEQLIIYLAQDLGSLKRRIVNNKDKMN